MEKRRFSRVPFRTLASVTAPALDVTIEGEVKNLSLNGLLLETNELLDTGTRLEMKIFLDGGGPDVEIKLKGHVVRATGAGLAIQFDMKSIPLESITHLRYVVSYNLGDGDMVMEEYFQHLDKLEST